MYCTFFNFALTRLETLTGFTWISFKALLRFDLTVTAGGLCVWDVGPGGNRHHRGPVNRRCPLQHQDDSPQKEEQLQAPEDEGQTAGGQYLSLFFSFGIKLDVNLTSFSPPQQLGESGTSRQDQAMLLADSSEDEF